MLSIDFVTTKEAAAIIGVTESRVCQLRQSGKLKAQQVDGRTWLIPRSEAERLAEQKPGPGRPRGGTKKS